MTTEALAKADAQVLGPVLEAIERRRISGLLLAGVDVDEIDAVIPIEREQFVRWWWDDARPALEASLRQAVTELDTAPVNSEKTEDGFRRTR